MSDNTRTRLRVCVVRQEDIALLLCSGRNPGMGARTALHVRVRVGVDGPGYGVGQPGASVSAPFLWLADYCRMQACLGDNNGAMKP